MPLVCLGSAGLSSAVHLPFHSRRHCGGTMPTSFRLLVPASVVTVVLVSLAAISAEPTVDHDLQALQGMWERTQVLPGQPGPQEGRVVKEVKGNRETVTTYDR